MILLTCKVKSVCIPYGCFSEHRTRYIIMATLYMIFSQNQAEIQFFTHIKATFGVFDFRPKICFASVCCIVCKWHIIVNIFISKMKCIFIRQMYVYFGMQMCVFEQFIFRQGCCELLLFANPYLSTSYRNGRRLNKISFQRQKIKFSHHPLDSIKGLYLILGDEYLGSIQTKAMI